VQIVICLSKSAEPLIQLRDASRQLYVPEGLVLELQEPKPPVTTACCGKRSFTPEITDWGIMFWCVEVYTEVHRQKKKSKYEKLTKNVAGVR